MSADGDIVRAVLDSRFEGDTNAALAALARLEAAEDECIKNAEEWASKFWQAERQRDALAEALREIRNAGERRPWPMEAGGLARVARAALAEAGLE